MSQHTRVSSASATSPFWQRSRPPAISSPRTAAPLSWHPRTPQPGASLTKPARPARPATAAGAPTPAPAALQIRSCIFCASLQDRPVWAPVVPLLLAGSKTATPRWERARLSSHDLAIRIGAGAGGSARDRDTDVVCRFLLAAPADVGRPETANRVQRLQRLQRRQQQQQQQQQQQRRGDAPTGQSVAAVLFLLTPSTGASGSNTSSGSGSTSRFTHRASMAAYEQLQALLHASSGGGGGETGSNTGPPLALLPVPAVEAVPATLAAFCGPLTRPAARQPRDRMRNDDDDDEARGVLRSTAAALGLPRPDEAVDRLVAQAAAAAGDGRSGIACADVLLACLGTNGKRRNNSFG